MHTSQFPEKRGDHSVECLTCRNAISVSDLSLVVDDSRLRCQVKLPSGLPEENASLCFEV
eukprot:COSAG06_NODE_71725_length_180_cov_30.839506_1_plen_59_part_11